MQTILITGATDGIGRKLADLYNKPQNRVILLGRRLLSALNDPIFTTDNYCQADLAIPASAAKVERWLAEQKITSLDLVIHNAGIGYVGDVAGQSAESIEQLVQVNLLSPLALTHKLLPLLEKKRGKLVFISSVVTAIATPQFAVYGATKAALDGFARSLRVETKGKVAVQVIHPGATNTGMHKKSGVDNKKAEKYVSAESVAADIEKIIASKKRQSAVKRSNKIVYALGNRAPNMVDGAMRFGRKSKVERGTVTPLHCVITGAADGIGKALAERYAAAGYKITGIDNDNKRALQTQVQLRQLGADCDFRIADIINEQEWIESLGPIDVFIHNAGISEAGRFQDSALENQLKVAKLNLLAPLQITARLLEKQKLTGGGSLVFISSLSRYVSYPGAAGYAASKDGLAHYARSLGVGLHPQQNVLTVYPGPIRTAHARRYSPDNSREHKRMLPSELADYIFEAEQARQRILFPGGTKVMASFGRNFPRLAEFAMKKTILDKL